MSSVYVVCWIFLQTFQIYIQANSVDPDQTAPRGAVWSGSTLFAKMTFKNHKQMTKQTTIIVIGALRVKRRTCWLWSVLQTTNYHPVTVHIHLIASQSILEWHFHEETSCTWNPFFAWTCFVASNCFTADQVHYVNTPIQIYWKFHHQKLKIFI